MHSLLIAFQMPQSVQDSKNMPPRLPTIEKIKQWKRCKVVTLKNSNIANGMGNNTEKRNVQQMQCPQSLNETAHNKGPPVTDKVDVGPQDGEWIDPIDK